MNNTSHLNLGASTLNYALRAYKDFLEGMVA